MVKQVIAPVNSCPQFLQARRQITRPAGQGQKTASQPSAHILRRKQFDAGCGQFNRQRQPIQAGQQQPVNRIRHLHLGGISGQYVVIVLPMDRAVLEQAADEVRQQVLVAADRRIHPAGMPETRFLHDHAVKFAAHAVQTLEFVIEPIAGEFGHGRDRVRVVRGELRVESGPVFQHLFRAGNVGDIGVRLAREHRISVEPLDLGVLDLAVPVGALDQAQRDAPAGFLGQCDQPVDDRRTPLLVGLHGKPEPRPSRARVAVVHRLEDVQRARGGHALHPE